MIKVLFTLDYEIHGNGQGNPDKLMVEPTCRLMELLDKYGARLTIMADVAEILKFKEYYEKVGKDDFAYLKIAEQLQYAVKKGHDVQLHIHSSYFKAEYENGEFKNCWEEYDLASLPYSRVNEMVRETKGFLEDILTKLDVKYSCTTFRAANWSMMPSKNIVLALKNNGIKIDTSVFKYGKRRGLVNFDYTECYNNVIPWPVNESDIRIRNSSGEIFEFPIFSTKMSIWSFFSLNRLYRVYLSKKHNFKDGTDYLTGISPKNFVKKSVMSKLYSKLTTKSALKADFNQCTGFQLIRQLKEVEAEYSHIKVDIPFVTIGHSKLFNSMNEKSLKNFLKFVADNPDKYCFSTFKDFDLESYRSN